ncbi:MAG TPA: Hsp70 family protein [Solirubrobacteraceae bacterium]|jgi:molecular chaperone DnaK|nr:Hsp70 family protein [Solirubrobacteraceae bacterium]
MKILGIDLGTTNSAVALVNQHGVPEIIANREGEYITPSVIFFDGGEAVVGRVAKHSAGLDPQNTVQNVKREMGSKSWRFYPSAGGEYSAEAISALILRRLREDAETIRGEEFTHAVISVPAYFADPERQATQDAAELAGLTPVRIINEPTAAALAFGLESSSTEDRIAVYDLGGGTFDVSILKITPGDVEVLGTGGDRGLGGVDWDNAIIEWIDEQYVAGGGQTMLDEDSDPSLLADLRDKAETAKHTLSQMRQTKIVLSMGPSHQTITLTRDTFEEITSELLGRTETRMEIVLEEAGLRWPDITKVLLVGGSTKMPAVTEMLSRVTGLTPSREVHPDEAVALGAAVQAALVAKTMPPSKTSGKGSSATGVPEETGIKEVNITDVTAHSLGVVVLDKQGQPYNQIVIDRGTQLPTRNEVTTYAYSENQTYWAMKLTQGEDREIRFVKVIGEGEIQYDTPKPRGYPILLRVSYDHDGLIHAHVFDGNTRAPFGELHITRDSNLSQDELDQMKRNVSGLTLG